MRYFFLSLFSLSLLACATNAEKAERISFSSNSKNAILLVKYDGSPTDAHIRFSRLNKNRDGYKQNMVTGAGMPNMELDYSLKEYSIAEVAAGEYFLSSYTLQDYWSLCFLNDTFLFKIEPGTINYVGIFETSQHDIELNQNVVKNGDTVVTNGVRKCYSKGITPPQLKSPSSDDIKRAEELLATRAPNIVGDIISPEAEAFVFKHKTIFGDD